MAASNAHSARGRGGSEARARNVKPTTIRSLFGDKTLQWLLAMQIGDDKQIAKLTRIFTHHIDDNNFN